MRLISHGFVTYRNVNESSYATHYMLCTRIRRQVWRQDHLRQRFHLRHQLHPDQQGRRLRHPISGEAGGAVSDRSSHLFYRIYCRVRAYTYSDTTTKAQSTGILVSYYSITTSHNTSADLLLLITYSTRDVLFVTLPVTYIVLIWLFWIKYTCLRFLKRFCVFMWRETISVRIQGKQSGYWLMVMVVLRVRYKRWHIGTVGIRNEWVTGRQGVWNGKRFLLIRKHKEGRRRGGSSFAWAIVVGD